MVFSFDLYHHCRQEFSSSAVRDSNTRQAQLTPHLNFFTPYPNFALQAIAYYYCSFFQHHKSIIKVSLAMGPDLNIYKPTIILSPSLCHLSADKQSQILIFNGFPSSAVDPYPVGSRTFGEVGSGSESNLFDKKICIICANFSSPIRL